MKNSIALTDLDKWKILTNFEDFNTFSGITIYTLGMTWLLVILISKDKKAF
jgi:hypothetical protein